MSTYWYIARGDKRAGPIAQERFLTLISAGGVKDHDLVWQPGYNDWLAFSKLGRPIKLTKWYLREGSETYGPITHTDLLALIKAEEIHEDHFLSIDLDGPWMRLENHPYVFMPPLIPVIFETEDESDEQEADAPATPPSSPASDPFAVAAAEPDHDVIDLTGGDPEPKVEDEYEEEIVYIDEEESLWARYKMPAIAAAIALPIVFGAGFFAGRSQDSTTEATTLAAPAPELPAQQEPKTSNTELANLTEDARAKEADNIAPGTLWLRESPLYQSLNEYYPTELDPLQGYENSDSKNTQEQAMRDVLDVFLAISERTLPRVTDRAVNHYMQIVVTILGYGEEHDPNACSQYAAHGNQLYEVFYRISDSRRQQLELQLAYYLRLAATEELDNQPDVLSDNSFQELKQDAAEKLRPTFGDIVEGIQNAEIETFPPDVTCKMYRAFYTEAMNTDPKLRSKFFRRLLLAHHS